MKRLTKLLMIAKSRCCKTINELRLYKNSNQENRNQLGLVSKIWITHDAAVALAVELGLKQEEESRRRCNAELAKVVAAAQKRAAMKMQSMLKVLFEGSDESGGADD